eukprot:g17692.t1
MRQTAVGYGAAPLVSSSTEPGKAAELVRRGQQGKNQRSHVPSHHRSAVNLNDAGCLALWLLVVAAGLGSLKNRCSLRPAHWFDSPGVTPPAAGVEKAGAEVESTTSVAASSRIVPAVVATETAGEAREPRQHKARGAGSKRDLAEESVRQKGKVGEHSPQAAKVISGDRRSVARVAARESEDATRIRNKSAPPARDDFLREVLTAANYPDPLEYPLVVIISRSEIRQREKLRVDFKRQAARWATDVLQARSEAIVEGGPSGGALRGQTVSTRVDTTTAASASASTTRRSYEEEARTREHLRVKDRGLYKLLEQRFLRSFYFVVGDRGCGIPDRVRRNRWSCERDAQKEANLTSRQIARLRTEEADKARTEELLTQRLRAEPNVVLLDGFLDVYTNLSAKARLSFRWALERYPRLRWITKVDGDIDYAHLGNVHRHLASATDEVDPDEEEPPVMRAPPSLIDPLTFAQGRGLKYGGVRPFYAGAGGPLEELKGYMRERKWEFYPPYLMGPCYAVTHALAARVAAAGDDLSSLEDAALALRLELVKEKTGASYYLVDDGTYFSPYGGCTDEAVVCGRDP